jgi:hypothetical protein
MCASTPSSIFLPLIASVWTPEFQITKVTRNLIPTPQFAYARRGTMTSSQHVYEIRPRNDKRGVDLISDGLPFGLLWYGEPNAISNAIGYARFYSRSHHALIRVYDETGNVIEMHDEQARDFKDW